MQNWRACLKAGVAKQKGIVSWRSPLCGVLKFNVDGAAKGKPGLTGIVGVLRNYWGEVLYIFSKHVGIKDRNEAGVLAISWKLFAFFHIFFHHFLIVESDSANAISWVKSLKGLWKMQFLQNEISHLISDINAMFQYISRSANGIADYLAKQGVNRSCNLHASIL